MAGEEIGNQSLGGTSWLSALRQPLTKVQAIVGITAGMLSVGGALFPLVGLTRVATHGEFVGVVQDARSHRPLIKATVEIVTADNAVVTTLASMDDGRVRQRLKEGQYRVRVTYPRFVPEVRQVLVIAGQTAEVHLALAPRPLPPPPPAKPVEKPGAVRRFFRNLGI
jgi:hypothetical protein